MRPRDPGDVAVASGPTNYKQPSENEPGKLERPGRLRNQLDGILF